MSTPVLGSYSFSSTPDVNGNLVLVSNTAAVVSSLGVGALTSSTALLELGAGTSTAAPVSLAAGALMTTPAAGSLEYDTAAMYKVVDSTNGRTTIDGWNYFRLTASGTAIAGGTTADFFGTNDGIPLVAGGLYEIEWVCYVAQSGGAATGTWVITSTNALQSLTGEYTMSPIAGIGAVGTPQTAGINVTTSTSTNFPVSGSLANNATHRAHIRVMLQANATTGGNTRLRYTPSVNTATPLINSYFKVRRIPAGNVGTFVA